MGAGSGVATLGLFILLAMWPGCGSSASSTSDDSSASVGPAGVAASMRIDGDNRAPQPRAPVTATADPDSGSFPGGVRSQSFPTAATEERNAPADTWLYLAGFQADHVYVVDPRSGHALERIGVSGDQAGVAVSPDGRRLYLVDGGPGIGRLRVMDVATQEVVHRELVPDPAQLLGGNPIHLSPDGRWLVVAHHSYVEDRAWQSVFDTEHLRFLPKSAWRLSDCNRGLTKLTGLPDFPLVYVQCRDSVVALDAETLASVWRTPSPNAPHPDLVLSSDDRRLYGLYPEVTIGHGVNSKGEGIMVVKKTALRLLVWDAVTGELLQEVQMAELVSVPPSTVGRGEGAYLARSRDGEQLFVAWEDRLWRLSTASLRITGQLELPTPVDGLEQNVDGRELYLLPSTAGDLERRERGMWTVDTETLRIVRRASDWPDLMIPFFFAAPPLPLEDGRSGLKETQPKSSIGNASEANGYGQESSRGKRSIAG